MKQVVCAMCGYVGYVKIRHIWEAHGHKWPQVWICDDCKWWK